MTSSKTSHVLARIPTSPFLVSLRTAQIVSMSGPRAGEEWTNSETAVWRPPTTLRQRWQLLWHASWRFMASVQAASNPSTRPSKSPATRPRPSAARSSASRAARKNSSSGASAPSDTRTAASAADISSAPGTSMFGSISLSAHRYSRVHACRWRGSPAAAADAADTMSSINRLSSSLCPGIISGSRVRSSNKRTIMTNGCALVSPSSERHIVSRSDPRPPPSRSRRPGLAYAAYTCSAYSMAVAHCTLDSGPYCITSCENAMLIPRSPPTNVLAAAI